MFVNDDIYFIFLSDMTENEKRKEGDYLMTCFVIHVSLLSLHFFFRNSCFTKKLVVYHPLTNELESSSGDYHDEMNGVNFFKWVKEKLIPHLPPKSVLIIDNAPYHNLQVDKCPTQASRKADIHTGLVDNTTDTFWRNIVEGRASPDLQAA